MFYKVVIGGVVVEYTRKREIAETAYKESDRRDKEIWKVGNKFVQRHM